MPVASPSELPEALVKNELDRIIGTPESQWVDFKEFAYDISRDKGKWELIKDVSAFANSGGGLIVIGVVAEKTAAETTEVARTVARIPKDSIDADAYRKIIGAGIYPKPKSLRMQWYADNPIDTEGIFLLEIVQQAENDKPFVIRRVLDDLGKASGAVGIPERDADLTDWWSAEKIHHSIAGPSSPLVGRDEDSGNETDLADVTEEASEELSFLEASQSWDEVPCYFLQTFDGLGLDLLPQFFGESGLAKTLENPPVLRGSGFNYYLAESPVFDGKALTVRSSRVAVRLSRKGVLSAGVVADRSYLQWAINDHVSPERNWINSVTLVELTLEYFRLMAAILDKDSAAQQWIHRIVCLRFGTARVALVPGITRRGMFGPRGKKAMHDFWDERFPDAGSPERNCFEALVRFYALFGLGPDAIPFTEGDRVPETVFLEQVSALSD